MNRVLRVLALLLALGSAIYIVAVYSSSPDRMPMQWNLQNRPTWTAPKAAFFGMFAGGLLLGVGFTFVRTAAPAGASVAFANALLLITCHQAATGGHGLSVGAATSIVLLVCLAGAGVTAAQARRAARTPGAGAPPPSRPRAS